MGKSKSKTAARKKAQAEKAKSSALNRRDILRIAGIGAIATGTAGWWGLTSFRAHAAEHDLSRIGGGQPALVQIHDPSCPSCTELQRETRQALRCVEGDPTYLVASIRTEDGAAYANRHGFSNVTLVLVDGDGEIENVLTGVRQSEYLKPILQEHFG